jgi:hypothetical protein
MVLSMAFEDRWRFEEATAAAIVWISSIGAAREFDGALLSVLATSTTSQCSAKGLRVLFVIPMTVAPCARARPAASMV